MSSSFVVQGEFFYGTNGAVEAFVERMAKEASVRFGSNDSMAVFLQYEFEVFFSNRAVFLDQLVADSSQVTRLLEVLDAATEQLRDEFTEYGKEWISVVIAQLRARISERRISEMTSG